MFWKEFHTGKIGPTACLASIDICVTQEIFYGMYTLKYLLADEKYHRKVIDT